jgi:CII-binding regulator of phage lambda lysogenization HflD
LPPPRNSNDFGYSKFASTKGKAKMPKTKVSKREGYVAKVKDQFNDINEQVDKLEQKSKSTRADLANKYKQEMTSIWR